MAEAAIVPLWLKLAYILFVPVMVVIYWRRYGPSNFLWLSDIALFLTALAVVFEAPIFASMAAVGVLPLELFWTFDFLLGGRFGLTAYMFDRRWALWLRAISLFHLALPPTLIWMLYVFGYDGRAFWWQLAVTLLSLTVCYALTDPEKNINWVFGPGERPQKRIDPRLYFAALMLVIPLGVMLPMHLLLTSVFGGAG